jgi:hypothetical protein
MESKLRIKGLPIFVECHWSGKPVAINLAEVVAVSRSTSDTYSNVEFAYEGGGRVITETVEEFRALAAEACVEALKQAEIVLIDTSLSPLYKRDDGLALGSS